MTEQQQYVTLSNGMRLVCDHHPAAKAEYFGIVIPVGSRAERPARYGMAHFVEHTIFKGTQRRRAWHILNRMEVLGGELNAYTTKEETVVYTAFPVGNLSRAADLLGDLLANSLFPQAELDKEREVVADEINSYLDNPADAVYDDFDDYLFGGCGLGHNILGTVDTLATFDSGACRQWIDDHYDAATMVAYYSGAMAPAQAQRVVERCVAQIRTSSAAPVIATTRGDTAAVASSPFAITKAIPSHQSHVVIGAPIGGVYSEGRLAMALLNNILGGPAMNSLLNIQLRERRGLVYTVESSTALYSDTGVLTIYFGCDPHDVERCAALVRKQIDALVAQPFTDRQMRQYVEQYIGQMTMSAENREQLAMSQARALTYFDNYHTIEQTAARLRALTTQHLQEAAATLQGASMLVFAPEQ